MSRGAIYVEPVSKVRRKTSRKPFGKRLFSVVAGVVVAVLGIGGVVALDAIQEEPQLVTTALATGVCSNPERGELGFGMDEVSSWEVAWTGFPFPEKSNRSWTIQEAFGAGIGFVNFNGIGDPGDAKVTPGYTPDEFFGKKQPADGTVEKLQNVRSFETCVGNNILLNISNFALGSVGSALNIVTGVTTMVFNPSIICQDSGYSESCFDIVALIGGGNGSEGGIIGALTDSIYMPLILLLAVIIGIWLAYNGLVKRQFRQAFSGALWTVAAVVFGLMLLFNPSLVAKAPMAATNALGDCVVGAFSGDNCFSGGGGSGIETNAGDVCQSNVQGLLFGEKMAMNANKLTCQIYKAFLVQPWSTASFGVSFDELYLDGPKANSRAVAAVNNAGYDVTDFCVNTESIGSMESFKGKTAEMTSGEICNLALYQMYLRVNVSGGEAGGPQSAANADKLDKRWLPLIETVAADEGYWKEWSSSAQSSFNKLTTPAVIAITTIAGGTVIVVTAFFALLFYFTSIIMFIFAPLFLLAAVHPGMGKRIFQGWLGQVLSSIMKYVASTLFLVVVIALLGAILGGVTNAALTLIFTIIMVIALMMYRREIVDMFGTVDMGGQKLSNRFMDKVGGATARVAKASTAGAVGSVAALGLKKGLNPVSVLTGATKGAYAGASKEMSRGRGWMQQAHQQKNLVQRDAIADLSSEAKRKANQANVLTTEVSDKREEVSDLVENMNTAAGKAADEQKLIVGFEESADKDSQAKQAINTDMTEVDAEFAKWKSLLAEAENKTFRAQIEVLRGNQAGADKLNAEASQLTADASTLHASLVSSRSERDLKNSEEYYAYLAQEEGGTLTAGDVKSADEASRRYTDHLARYNHLQGEYGQASAELVELSKEQKRTATEANALNLTHQNLGIDSQYKRSHLEGDKKKAAEKANEAAEAHNPNLDQPMMFPTSMSSPTAGAIDTKQEATPVPPLPTPTSNISENSDKGSGSSGNDDKGTLPPPTGNGGGTPPPDKSPNRGDNSGGGNAKPEPKTNGGMPGVFLDKPLPSQERPNQQQDDRAPESRPSPETKQRASDWDKNPDINTADTSSGRRASTETITEEKLAERERSRSHKAFEERVNSSENAELERRAAENRKREEQTRQERQKQEDQQRNEQRRNFESDAKRREEAELNRRAEESRRQQSEQRRADNEQAQREERQRNESRRAQDAEMRKREEAELQRRADEKKRQESQRRNDDSEPKSQTREKRSADDKPKETRRSRKVQENEQVVVPEKNDKNDKNGNVGGRGFQGLNINLDQPANDGKIQPPNSGNGQDSDGNHGGK